MTYSKQVTLMCDGPGRDNDTEECYEMYHYDRGKATEAREVAKKDGWTNRGSEDYCPYCSEKLDL